MDLLDSCFLASILTSSCAREQSKVSFGFEKNVTVESSMPDLDSVSQLIRE